MFPLIPIFAVAAALVGGAAIACSEMEASNKRKSDELKKAHERNVSEMKAALSSLSMAQRQQDEGLRRKELRAALKVANAAEKAMLRNWQEVKADVAQLKCQLDAAFRRKTELHAELDAFKTECRRTAGGAKVDFNSNPEYRRRVDAIRELTGFCQRLLAQKRIRIEEKKSVWDSLQDCNRRKREALANCRKHNDQIDLSQDE